MDLSPDEDHFDGRLLHQAALWDNLELVQELLAAGAAPDARDAAQRSALHAAALAERSRCLAALLDAGAPPDAACAAARTALHLAAERGHADNVRTLLAAGARPDLLDARGDSALSLAERGGHRHAAAALRAARVALGARPEVVESADDAFDAAYYFVNDGDESWRQRDARPELPEGADAAFDVTDYFMDDAGEPWRHRDALERSRLSAHAALRELVVGGDAAALGARLRELGPDAGLVVNLTPGGANTLLYVACASGGAAAAAALLAAGADGRAHPVTLYGPLYVAAVHGHEALARLLLDHFPAAVQQETVERWLPLHAAAIGGHAALVRLLLEYPYPEDVLAAYTDPRGELQYRAAFDVNARDVSSQTALYIACTLGNLPVVDALLAHTVPAAPVGGVQPEPVPAAPSPARSGISLGIHAIVSKLTGGGNRPLAPPPARVVRPVRLDAARGDSCVASAARGDHRAVLARLLGAGADANAPAAPPDTPPPAGSQRRRSRSAGRESPAARDCGDDGPWTALAIACRMRHVAAAEMLLAAGACDPTCRALREAARHQLTDLMAKILATKAYPDPDSKLDKSAVSEAVLGARGEDAALTFAARCPSTPVMVSWRDLRVAVPAIRMSWLRAACVRVNARLAGGGAALGALTRLDVAGNELRQLPHELFGLISIRYINAAQNKLDRLPEAPRRAPRVYSAPRLQELYLQDNRLEELPPGLFSLPALATLDVSNNKLRELPAALWAAPALRDLNAALNHLRDLPHGEGEEAGSQPSSPASDAPHTLAQPEDPPPPPPADDDDSPATVRDRTNHAVASESVRAHVWRGAVEAAPAPPRGGSALHALNLSHNQFTCVPPALACRATSLARLNMAYNSLRSMSYVTSYPSSLRQLDLSHNEITCWPSLPQVDSFSSAEGSPLACYCPAGAPPAAPRRPRSGGSVRAALLSAACPARRHLRLEGLRTLILSNNLLTRIQLTTDDDGVAPPDDRAPDDDDDWSHGSQLKGRLLFPLLSMLDVSCNLLRAVPAGLHALASLAVLNISGNKDISDLPPQLGQLSRLWSLSAAGCSLAEPLRSMLAGGRYRSADVVGYLKSVLHAATKYARMKLMLVGEQGIGKTSLLECLRQESALQHRRKPTEHWAKRMGNKSSRRNMSTVGVDIGTWVYEKSRSTRGPITFRTWDFGGQQEYYATHQYFLSRRSLYLVVWRATDGRRGLATALRWLRSIQARAPGAPVIMVATHYDQVANCSLPESESPEALQRLVRARVMAAPDADKLGLPRVMDSIEISCSTRHNIRLLADIIYSVAFSVKPPGSKEPLLEQRVPASYLALEECVAALAQRPDPVLRHHEYKTLVGEYMQAKGHRTFRDNAELHQATMFLHDNGVLLHYDDATLKELYFVRPQWLCDVLAHVVTVREINPFAANGIMKVEDLAHVFKASPALARGEEARALALSLLHKFELALCWDARVLLVPALLPPREPLAPQLAVRAPAAPRRAWPAPPHLAPLPEPARGTDSPTLIQETPAGVSVAARAGRALRRVLLASYVPSGFWARLVTRLLADAALARAPHDLYRPAAAESEVEESISRALELNWGWKLWQSGLVLGGGALTLLSLRELPPPHDALLGSSDGDVRVEGYISSLRVQQEGAWCALDTSSSAAVELVLPAQVAVARRDDGLPLAGYQSVSVEPRPEVLARVLALVSDHVDLLLEDWYPSLGTRFVHTSEGRCLITRVAPCAACLRDRERAGDANDDQAGLARALRQLDLDPAPRLSQESRASDGDSGVDAESNASSRLGSVEGVGSAAPAPVYAWTVEQCILAACEDTTLRCPQHENVSLRDLAPDTLLLDVEEHKRARWEHITRTAVAGRGAFGTVLTATWRAPGREPAPVALKALQPVPPPPGADLQAQHAYKAAQSRWAREPAAAACRAYCGLRQELGILAQLRHAHVLPLRAVCRAPLALLLALAPLGALDGVVREYRRSGARVRARASRAVLLQAARALEYLHDHRVVYRDLKSENVLVWRMPRPNEAAAAEAAPGPVDVHVKLGDYGISRLAPPSGTKGFGGTEGFMAPEIMRYNGEEEYNEKVDCFSFGMLVYEVVTGRQPFEGCEAVREAVLEGGRPALTPRDLEVPAAVLDVMRRCWAGAPAARPSAAALVSALAAPEYAALRDAAAARPARCAAAGAVALPEEGGAGAEIWYGGCEPERLHALLATPHHLTTHHTVRVPPESSPALVTALCRVGNRVWAGDSAGRLSVYSASTCALLWTTSVEGAVGDEAGGVAALAPLPGLPRVAIALDNGRLFLVESGQPGGGRPFVVSELGAATELCCLAALPAGDGSCEVWAGGSQLSAYRVGRGGASSAERAPAPGRVVALAAAAGHVFGYCDSGACVYQWEVSTKQQLARLDCSKLAPCSESLQSSAMDDVLAAPRCRVTALAAVGAVLAAGTAAGCLVVADAATLRPITVCRPYEADISVIVALPDSEDGPMMASFGSGYRPLLQRYAPHTSTSNVQYTGCYCILWKAQHWLPD